MGGCNSASGIKNDFAKVKKAVPINWEDPTAVERIDFHSDGTVASLELHMADCENINIPALVQVCGQLQYLDLSKNGKTVLADLNLFVTLSNLEQLNLDACPLVTGSLEALSDLHELRSLNLATCGVEGDVRHLASLTALTEIDLSYCRGIRGSLHSLVPLELLKKLKVASCCYLMGYMTVDALQFICRITNVGGLVDLTGVGPHELVGEIQRGGSHLRTLKFRGFTCLKGDMFTMISGLLPQLQHADFGGCRAMSGSLADLAKCTQLTYLDLFHTNITGDIEVFSALTELRVLNLAATFESQYPSHHWGDVASLGPCRNLECVMLDLLNVHGDITFLSCATLRRLSATHTGVRGDIGMFIACPRIQIIELCDTLVTGDIDVFHHTPSLTKLILFGTAVTGDVAVFQSTPRLQEIWLGDVHHGSDIFGDIEVFSHLRLLRRVSLAETEVWGDVTALRAILPQCDVLYRRRRPTSHSYSDVPESFLQEASLGREIELEPPQHVRQQRPWWSCRDDDDTEANHLSTLTHVHRPKEDTARLLASCAPFCEATSPAGQVDWHALDSRPEAMSIHSFSDIFFQSPHDEEPPSGGDSAPMVKTATDGGEDEEDHTKLSFTMSGGGSAPAARRITRRVLDMSPEQ